MESLFRDVYRQLSDFDKRLRAIAFQSRAEFTGGVSRVAIADLPPNMAGRVNFVTNASRPDGGTGALEYNDGTVWVSVHDAATFAGYSLGVPEYTVDTLPTPPSTPTGVRAVAFATNGRKAGEGVGAGTGVPVYWNDATNQWLVYRNDSVVQD